MKRSIVFLLCVMLTVSAASAAAETYTWTDEQGTVHFTEDLGAVPAKFRNKVRTVEETEPPPSLPAAVSKGAAGEQKNVPAANAGKRDSADGDTYGGKSYQQWQTELAEKESAMTAVRNRIEEIVLKLKSFGIQWQSQDKLLAEHEALSAKFKEMKVEYNQLVESARKAGIEVNIQ